MIVKLKKRKEFIEALRIYCSPPLISSEVNYRIYCDGYNHGKYIIDMFTNEKDMIIAFNDIDTEIDNNRIIYSNVD